MGLLKTAAKAYVATRVVSSTHRRQQQRWAEEDQSLPAAAAQPAGGGMTTLDQLAQLGQLRDAGILTDAEFEAKKQHILANM